jgi:hypothetical protein
LVRVSRTKTRLSTGSGEGGEAAREDESVMYAVRATALLSGVGGGTKNASRSARPRASRAGRKVGRTERSAACTAGR